MSLSERRSCLGGGGVLNGCLGTEIWLGRSNPEQTEISDFLTLFKFTTCKSTRNCQMRLLMNNSTINIFLRVHKYFTPTHPHWVITRHDCHTLRPMVFVFTHTHSHSVIRRHDCHTLPPMVFVFTHTHSHSVIRRHYCHTLPPMVFVFTHTHSHSVITRHDCHTLPPMVFVFFNLL